MKSDVQNIVFPRVLVTLVNLTLVKLPVHSSDMHFKWPPIAFMITLFLCDISILLSVTNSSQVRPLVKWGNVGAATVTSRCLSAFKLPVHSSDMHFKWPPIAFMISLFLCDISILLSVTKHQFFHSGRWGCCDIRRANLICDWQWYSTISLLRNYKIF